MKTMKTLSRRMAALFLVVVVGLTALAPAASAAAIQLPSLPKDKCVVDDAGVRLYHYQPLRNAYPPDPRHAENAQRH